MRSLFFVDHISTSILLSGEQGHHAADVMRLRVGEEIDVSDRSRFVRARITAVTKGQLEAEIVEELPLVRPRPEISVAQALIKGDSLSESVDIMSQVGVDSILLWKSERTIVQWDQHKTERNAEKLQTTAFESSKQARRPTWPKVGPVVTTQELLDRSSEFDRVVILHESGREHLADDDFDLDSVLLVVGPEGGVSDTELERLAAVGVVRRLGPTVIRSAQAAAIAAAVIYAKSSWRSN